MSQYPGNVDFLNFTQYSPSMDGADGYGRIRNATPYCLFASTFDLGDDASLWNASTATGGTTTHDTNKKRWALAVTTSSGSQALRESRQRMYLQPGRSNLAIMCGLFDSGQANTTQRIGVFSDSNGAFFAMSGTSFGIITRTKVSGSVVDAAIVTQSSFNIDKLDGSGASGLTLDLTKMQQWVIEWTHAGVGMFRFGVIIRGRIVWMHYIDNNNALTDTWMQTGSLPVRYEVLNTAGASAAKTLLQGPCAVFSDGDPTQFGKNFSIRIGANHKVINQMGTGMQPLFLLRLKSGSEFGQMCLRSLFTVAASNGGDTLNTQLVLNPTITGGTAASYNSVNAESAFEFDVAATGVVTAGTILGNYLSGGVAPAVYLSLDLSNEFGNRPQTFKNYAGTKDVLCVAAGYHNGYGAGASPYVYSTLNWMELDG